ncbi:O-antigen polymerase [Dokdonia ponticola]|uniref:O-antigen polymerase n=1 Tax=Dokdonia ponticola TaxID=2041041 RepID=A0ABV9HU19_9FLAO
MKKILISLILIFANLLLFSIDDFMLIGSIYFYFCSLFLGIEILIFKKFEVIHVWMAAFMFIILSEVFTYTPSTIDTNYPDALRYLITSNNLVLIGYISGLSNILYPELKITSSNSKFSTSKLIPFLFIILISFYVGFKIKNAILTFSLGRNVIGTGTNDSFILGSIINALGYVLPAIIAYYYIILKEESFRKAFILSAPIFLILFMNGTRFPLLFAVLGFVLVAQSKNNKKEKSNSLFFIGSVVIALFLLTTVMKHIRSSTTRDTDIVFVESYSSFSSFPAYASSFMSPEGVVDMTSLLFKYFDTNEFKYGSSSSFILYFWVPRSVWEDKPTMLGYWLIREFRSGYSDGHSSSFGFTGDFYADFGYFSYIPIFFIGTFLRWFEDYRIRAIKENSFSIVVASMLLPYCFFFVRSPITSTMNFIAILLFYSIFKKILFSVKK